MPDDQNHDRLFTLIQTIDTKIDGFDTRVRSLEVWRGYVLGIVTALLFVSSIVLALR